MKKQFKQTRLITDEGHVINASSIHVSVNGAEFKEAKLIEKVGDRLVIEFRGEVLK